MHKVIAALFGLFIWSSCSKSVENVQEDLVVKAMTTGQWKVTKYTRGAVEETSGFAPYSFQFYENNTVEALENGTTRATGTWSPNPAARQISAQFSNNTTVVGLLNGTWLITKNSWTYVEATQTVSGEVRTLRLDK